MNILVIGSKGFIGSHCVSYFKKEHNVYQCDVMVDYTTKQYIQVDATNADYNEVMQVCDFDVCINCSGAASVPDSLKNPQRDFMLNTANAFKQLDALRKYNANCRYLNISSAAVYGNPEQLPIVENQSLNAISPYGIHKKLAEDICKEFHDIYNLKTCSLRVFSAYGVGLQKQLFWDLFQKSKNEKSVKLFGTGEESRDFIYIDDLVNAINVIIKNCAFNNDIINVANGEEVTIKIAAKAFYNLFNEDISIEFQGENRHGDPVNWVADITKLKSLGYKQKVSLEKGLKKYYKWLLENA